MRRVLILVCSLLILSACNGGTSKESSKEFSDITESELSFTTEGNSEPQETNPFIKDDESKLSSVSSESSGKNSNSGSTNSKVDKITKAELRKTKSYVYYKTFDSMNEATLQGEMVQYVGDDKMVTPFKICKSGKKLYTEMTSSEYIINEYFDGSKYYSLNRTAKRYVEIEGLSYDFSEELNSLFNDMRSVVISNNIETFTLSDVNFAVHGDVVLVAETTDRGVSLKIKRVDSNKIQREINFSISKLSEEDKAKFTIDGFSKESQ